MEHFDSSLMSGWRDFEEGLQQILYYSLFLDVFILLSIGTFVWCCCAYVLSYKKFVDENIRIKRSEQQYFMAKAERERLEAKRIKIELGFNEDVCNALKSK
ncbi:hypothetical protein [Nonlabens sp.]|jgi:hypothetical protein|uniref:hypothetical protein n=1 Tax=Nonlabens sp. TaxID=1888209 RepID=UPI001BD103E6|nr:hypothetical protein [Nonlabens sp.]